MRIRALELEGFQGYPELFRLEDLDEGLNVIAGDNEEGKSTLLRAIKAVVFDRFGSSAGEAFRPFGQELSPRVALEFELAGERWQLEKVFSRRRDGGARLSSGGGAWRDAAAEEKLAELLGFDYAGRGPSRSELQGMAGVLWVEQGQAHAAPTLNDRARGVFEAVFDQEITGLLGGDRGGRLVARVAELRAELLTETGRPRGRFRALQEELAEGAGELQRVRGELAEHEERVRELEHVNERLDAFAADEALGRARERLEAARRSRERIEALEGELRDAESRCQLRRLEAQGPARTWQERQDAAARVETLGRTVEEARAAAARADEALAPLRRRAEELRESLGEARREREVLDQALGRARTGEELEALGRRRAESLRVLAQARRAGALRHEQQRIAAAIAVDESVLEGLREAEAAAERDRQRLEAVATRLDFDLQPGEALVLAGERIEGTAQRRITTEARLELGAAGHVTISPGAAELGTLREAVRASRERRRRLLAEAGVASLDEALDAARRRRSAERSAAEQRAILEALAPDGLGALESEAERLAAEATRLEKALGAEPAPAESRSSLETRLAAAAQRVADLDAEREAAEQALAAQGERLAERRHAADSAARELAQAEASLARERDAQGDLALQVAAQAAAEASRAAASRVEDLRRALAREDPAAARLEEQRRETVVEQLTAERRTLEQRARDLQVALATLGQRGLAEEEAALAGRHAARERELSVLRRRAEALELLHRTLGRHLREAREALVAPLRERLGPYLRQLLPESSALLDEHFGLAGLRRGQGKEPFEALSIGTREQIAVLVRLAYADLLADRGLPSCVILDDALVNSDDARREIMKRLLYQAGRRHQVIVLTCHARDYRDAGGRFLRIEDLRARSRSPAGGEGAAGT